MEYKISQFEGLSTKEDFNLHLRHFNLVMDILEDFEKFTNLADIINNLCSEKNIMPSQIKPILNALLIDKYCYHSFTYNLKENIECFDSVVCEVKKWTSLDIVIAYYSPELGIFTVNPKNKKHWEQIQVFKCNELITIYSGAFNKLDNSKKIYSNGICRIIDLLEEKSFKTPTDFTGGKFKQPQEEDKKAAPNKKPAGKRKKSTIRSIRQKNQSSSVLDTLEAQALKQPSLKSLLKMRMTPQYGIVVSNELFHNGNVESWKKIIESYEISHPGLKVFVYYDGEQIHDINTLFKWGKVKRGTAIMISVGGENIKDVARLQKYLRQGASHMFEAFLKGPPNQILKLF